MLPQRYPIIVGPTAGGKTALAVEVAVRINESAGRAAAEVVSADSMLIYKGLDIGAAKPTLDERQGIPHHLIDLVEPTQRFTIHDWLKLAHQTIADIQSRGSVPIVVGGTHLYIKALLEGMFEGPGEDQVLRAQLRAMEPAAIRAELERVDPAAAARLHPNDLRRSIRALEVFRLTGTPISRLQRQWDAEQDDRPADHLLIGLAWPSEVLNGRINARVKKMIEQGLVEEAFNLWQANKLGPQAREALGYKQLNPLFERKITLNQAIEDIKIETRRFAKNQRTWMRRLRTTPGSVWIDAAATPAQQWPDIVLEACSTQENAA
jgi:tRNA dimethylallyltransferase